LEEEAPASDQNDPFTIRRLIDEFGFTCRRLLSRLSISSLPFKRLAVNCSDRVPPRKYAFLTEQRQQETSAEFVCNALKHAMSQ
jgi:hypothetical protein